MQYFPSYFVVALEPRSLTRFDMRKFARHAYEAGIGYIGGCCYFEAYHIREIVDEVRVQFIFHSKSIMLYIHTPFLYNTIHKLQYLKLL